MTSSLPHFQVTSNQTALVFIIPPHLQSDINSLRSIHDKSFRKWDPHISILYPFVEPSLLPSAIATLQAAIHSGDLQPPTLGTDEVGVFRHRKNATIFIKPDPESEERLCRLRQILVESLGCKVGDGTHDGIYRPHLTVGQAALVGSSIEKLVEQVAKIKGLEWEGRTLAVLKREISGEMRVVEELHLNAPSDGIQSGKHV